MSVTAPLSVSALSSVNVSTVMTNTGSKANMSFAVVSGAGTGADHVTHTHSWTCEPSDEGESTEAVHHKVSKSIGIVASPMVAMSVTGAGIRTPLVSKP